MTINTAAEPAQKLRQRAEAKYQIDKTMTSQPLSPTETEHLLHELQVHQIELEMQNEELRLSQCELESARANYFDLYDLAPVGYLTISEKGLIQQANLAAATMLGVARNFLPNKRISRFVFPEDQDVYFQHRKQLFDSGELQNWEMRLKRSDGSLFWAALLSTLAHNSENWITLHDITERKLAEEALREMADKLETQAEALCRLNESLEQQTVLLQRERERLAGIIRGTNAGTWEWSVQTGETVFNDRWAEMLGCTLKEISPVSTETWMKFGHPDDLKVSNELLEKHFRGELDYLSLIHI